jgi:hypothetical protein
MLADVGIAALLAAGAFAFELDMPLYAGRSQLSPPQRNLEAGIGNRDKYPGKYSLKQTCLGLH